MRPLKTILISAIVAAGVNIASGTLSELGVDIYNLGKASLINQTGTVTQADSGSGFGIISIIFGVVSLGLVIYALILMRKKIPATTTISDSAKPTYKLYPSVDESNKDGVLDDLFARVKHEFVVIAIEYGSLGYYEKEIKSILARGVKVSWYILEPDTDAMIAAQKCGLATRNTTGTATGNVTRFCEFKSTLGEEEKKNLNLYKFREPLAHTMIIVDPDHKHSKIQMQPILYETIHRKKDVPTLVIEYDDPSYGKLMHSARYLMDKYKKPHTCASDDPVVSV